MINLFTFASSELSQDAVIAWFISWSDSSCRDSILNEYSVRFVNCIVGKFGENINQVNSVKVLLQKFNIDILVEINQKYILIIENKVRTKNHSKQLTRYKTIVESEYPDHIILPLFYKTYEQSDLKVIIESEYQIFTRNDFLQIFKMSEIVASNNDILIDYYNHLTSIESSIKSFKTQPLSKWTNDSWIGLFNYLKPLLPESQWDYVPNKGGGFIGLWWNFNEVTIDGISLTYYFQLNRGDFLVKLVTDDILQNYEGRDKFRNATTSNLQLMKKWGSCQKGVTVNMTAFKFNDSYIVTKNGIIDLDSTIIKITKFAKSFKIINAQNTAATTSRCS